MPHCGSSGDAAARSLRVRGRRAERAVHDTIAELEMVPVGVLRELLAAGEVVDELIGSGHTVLSVDVRSVLRDPRADTAGARTCIRILPPPADTPLQGALERRHRTARSFTTRFRGCQVEWRLAP